MSDLNTLIAQRQSLDAQIERAQRESKAQNLQRIRSLMAETGVTVEDLAPARPGKARRNGGSVAPKYRDTSGNTWSGRGSKPRWLQAAIAGGQTLESFRIAE